MEILVTLLEAGERGEGVGGGGDFTLVGGGREGAGGREGGRMGRQEAVPSVVPRAPCCPAPLALRSRLMHVVCPSISRRSRRDCRHCGRP